MDDANRVFAYTRNPCNGSETTCYGEIQLDMTRPRDGSQRLHNSTKTRELQWMMGSDTQPHCKLNFSPEDHGNIQSCLFRTSVRIGNFWNVVDIVRPHDASFVEVLKL